MHVLLVEDEARVAGFIRRGLREERFVVDVAVDGEQALLAIQTGSFDLIILDLLLPKKNGMEVLRTLRARKIDVPVLILTAKDNPQDKVAGLNAGADDYLTKPFGFEELLARVRALLRRRGSGGLSSEILRAGDLEMDTHRHRVVRAGSELILTNREYVLLEYFLRNPDRVVTRAMLSENVWEQSFDTFSNVIDVHIARLRRKIDEDFSAKLLHTVRGSGYVLKIPQVSKAR